MLSAFVRAKLDFRTNYSFLLETSIMVGRIILTIVLGTIGVGIGFAGGAGYRFVADAVVGSATGICMTMDTAASEGLMTSAQAERLGQTFIKQAPTKDQAKSMKSVMETGMSKSGEACKKFHQGLSQS
jgi:hypothetical protein